MIATALRVVLSCQPSASGRERNTSMTRQASGINFKVESDLSRYLKDAIIDFNDDGDDQGSGEGADDGASGSGDSDDSGEGGEGANGSADSGSIKDPDKKRLSDEAAAQRIKAKAEKERADKLDAELRKLQDKDKTELELKTREAKESAERAERAESLVKSMAVELAFYRSGVVGRLEDPSDAYALLDFSDITPDDDGKVDEKVIKERLEELLKRKPYLSRKSGDDDGGSTGGSPSNGRRKTKDEAASKKLMEKYPALAQRG